MRRRVETKGFRFDLAEITSVFLSISLRFRKMNLQNLSKPPILINFLSFDTIKKGKVVFTKIIKKYENENLCFFSKLTKDMGSTVTTIQANKISGFFPWLHYIKLLRESNVQDK
jgi:hypothetical protein